MKDLLLTILKRELDNATDDLHRATMRFGQMTEEQLVQKFGQTNRTCKSVFETYKKNVEILQKLFEWAEEL